MTTPQDIENWIKAGLPCDYLHVDGDGQHFEATIVSAEFTGKMRIAQHQLVYKVLGDKMDAQIHALSMRTLTPAEWEAQRG
jgi:acid stress-induced BolA-like protein IbaG/YrbA